MVAWDALLSMLSRVGADVVWTSLSPDSAVAIRPLLLNLRRGAHGAGSVAYRSMLPVLSMIRRTHRLAIVDALFEGMTSSSEWNKRYQLASRRSLLEAHAECLTYVLGKDRRKKSSEKEEETSSSGDVINIEHEMSLRLSQVLRWSMEDLFICPETLCDVGQCHVLLLLSTDVLDGTTRDQLWKTMI